MGYGAYSKDVEVFAYLRCQDHDVFLAIQEDLLLRIEEVIEAAGSGFAFPSQTAYLAQPLLFKPGKPIDADRALVGFESVTGCKGIRTHGRVSTRKSVKPAKNRSSV